MANKLIRTFNKYRLAYFFIFPTFIGMLIMHFTPIVQGFYMALLKLDNYTLSQYLSAPFIGLDNFMNILFNPDSPMRIGIFDSIRNTIIYAILVTIGQIGMGMIVALMLNLEFRARSLVRTLFLFSWIVPTYVAGLLWGFMWQRDVGIINIILYDWLKIHIIAEKLNALLFLCKLDFIPKAINFVILPITEATHWVLNSNLYTKISIYIIITCLLIVAFKFIKSNYSAKKAYWFLVFVFIIIFVAIIKITMPTSFSTDYKIAWLTGSNTIWAIIIPTIWRFWPLSMLMLLAGLQNIPDSLYQAAKIDGANSWTIFWKITWPMLMPVWMILVLFGLIYNVYSFNIVIMMFGNGAGFPGEWGDLMMTNIFRNSFQRWDFGAGAATSVLLLLVMIVVVNIWFKFYKKSEEIF